MSAVPSIVRRRAILVIAGYLAFDFLLPIVLWAAEPRSAGAAWLVAGVAGVFVSQLDLIAIWGIWGPGHFLRRLWWIFLAAAAWLATVLGIRLPNSYMPLEFFVQLGMMIFAGTLLLQFPLWLARRLNGRRLIDDNRSPSAPENTAQFRLKDIMLLMVLLSVALALGRLVLPRQPHELADRAASRSLMAMMVLSSLIPVVMLAFINGLVALPWAWIAFAEKKWLDWCKVAWPWYCVGLSAVEFLVAFVLFGPGLQAARTEETVAVGASILALNFGQYLPVMITLLVFRGAGIRLVRGRPAAAAPPPPVP